MPRLSEFFGIVISLYWAETGRHNAPHFHARYGEYEGVFSIPGADLLAGSCRVGSSALVQAWAELYAEELERAWGLATTNEPPGTIPPLTK